VKAKLESSGKGICGLIDELSWKLPEGTEGNL